MKKEEKELLKIKDTNNLKVITLVTCDSLNNKYRTIVKAKEL